MLLFYSIADKNKLKELNITTGPVWRIVQENLYKFLLFLIGTVDFTLEGLGAAQWLFWNGLLSRVDFSSTPDPTKLFKYSRSYCNKTSYDNKKIDICDNYNDMVMRLLEEKVSLVLEIKLAADSNYLNGAQIPGNFPADLLKEETFKHYLSLYNNVREEEFEKKSKYTRRSKMMMKRKARQAVDYHAVIETKHAFLEKK